MARDKRKDVKVAFTIKKQGIGWAVRKEDVQLLSALNAFIKKNYRGFFYNTLKDKYFKNTASSGAWSEKFRYDTSGNISPYDEMAKKYAGKYGLDWRLIVAQIFQESGFNPRKVSWAGAKGLMQVMPRTARELGLKDLYDPESSIKAGTYYLKKLLDRFAPSIKLKDRIRFALAAYHVGYNHVADARLLARRQGLDPDVWFENVEKAMLLLQKRVYYRKTRYGYCNGRRTVNYVREILNRYNTYLRADVNKAA
jgi:membrane-bound lytic murein transglycosylase F